jgi:SnoaL-like domain
MLGTPSESAAAGGRLWLGRDGPAFGDKRGPMGISRSQAVGFVQGYGRTWENWDFDGFVDLFTEDVVYVEHPTDETVVGRDQMQAYIRAEYDDQGVATVQTRIDGLMALPVVR